MFHTYTCSNFQLLVNEQRTQNQSAVLFYPISPLLYILYGLRLALTPPPLPTTSHFP
ncbi:unnamed protein product, partial [Hymenolepis diminuta]